MLADNKNNLFAFSLVIESAETEMRPKHPISLSEADQKVVSLSYLYYSIHLQLV